MSEFDLGPTVSTSAAPADMAGVAPVLTPPAPVVVVQEEQAQIAVPVDSAKQVELCARATTFVAELTALDARSPEFTQKISAITSMGKEDLRAASAFSGRMLERPASLARDGKDGGDAQTRVASTLAELRTTVTDLDPKRADLSRAKKVLRWVPGSSAIERYFARYQPAQSHLDAIMRALASGQDELRKDNAAIEVEKANMWTTMGKLAEYSTLAAALDQALERCVAELETAGRGQDADSLRSDGLFPVRQRRQDFLTQMTVCVQGHMALDLVRRNNVELIKGVDRAQTTTIAALRTAVIVSGALARQKLVLDQVTALNAMTSDFIESTPEQLRVQGTAVNQETASTPLDVAKLQAAFDNVFATMDALDTFRAQAAGSMAQTVDALETQITRVRTYLERTRQLEAQE